MWRPTILGIVLVAGVVRGPLSAVVAGVLVLDLIGIAFVLRRRRRLLWY